MSLIPVHKPQNLAKQEDCVFDAHPINILILDPHLLFRAGLMSLLKDQTDIQISAYEDPGSNLIQLIQISKPNIIIMSGASYEAGGREAMIKILSEYPEVTVLILAFQEGTELMLDAIRNGAKGYLPMDFTKSTLVKSLRAMARGELAIPRSMTTKMAEALSRMSRGLRDDIVEMESVRLTMHNEILLRLCASNNTLHIEISSNIQNLG
jgi:two-component system NarL family response regulator